MHHLNQLISQIIMLTSLMTACGVLVHDTHLDKAFTASVNHQLSDAHSEATGRLRPGGNAHPHAEHLKIPKDGSDNPCTVPRKRDKKHIVKRRVARGYHGDNFCMPLAGEWA